MIPQMWRVSSLKGCLGLISAMLATACATKGDVQRLRSDVDVVADGYAPAMDSLRIAIDLLSMFNAGVDMLERGNFRTARVALEQFVTSYPDDPRVPQARMHLGEMLQNRRQPSAATDQYAQLAEEFPWSEQTPQALYRAGLLLHDLGEIGRARQCLRRLVTRYARHRLTPLARRRLEELSLQPKTRSGEEPCSVR